MNKVLQLVLIFILIAVVVYIAIIVSNEYEKQHQLDGEWIHINEDSRITTLEIEDGVITKISWLVYPTYGVEANYKYGFIIKSSNVLEYWDTRYEDNVWTSIYTLDNNTLTIWHKTYEKV